MLVIAAIAFGDKRSTLRARVDLSGFRRNDRHEVGTFRRVGLSRAGQLRSRIDPGDSTRLPGEEARSRYLAALVTRYRYRDFALSQHRQQGQRGAPKTRVLVSRVRKRALSV